MFGLEVGGDACGIFAEHPHVALEVKAVNGLTVPLFAIDIHHR